MSGPAALPRVHGPQRGAHVERGRQRPCAGRSHASWYDEARLAETGRQHARLYREAGRRWPTPAQRRWWHPAYRQAFEAEGRGAGHKQPLRVACRKGGAGWP